MIRLIVSILLLLSIDLNLLLAKNVVEYTDYPRLCTLAVEDPALFQHFKSQPAFFNVFGCSYQIGLESLNWVKKYRPELMAKLEACQQNDNIGNPKKENYGEYGYFFPATLRDVKIVGDLKKNFGDLEDLHIVEVGGYGGLCKVIDALTGFASYTIVNLPECNELAKKYVQAQRISNVHFVNISDLEQLKTMKYDLAISHFLFAEMDKKDQHACIQCLFEKASNGYLVLNFISSVFQLQSLSLDELIAIFYQQGKTGCVEEEEPLTYGNNVVMTWKDVKALNRYKDAPKKAEALIPSGHFQARNAVSYTLSGGRLGDNLVAYLHAKWIAYKYSLPLLYVPFPYSNAFVFDQQEQPLHSQFSFQHQSVIHSEYQLLEDHASTLFTVTYFPEAYAEYHLTPIGPYMDFVFVDWDHPFFKHELKTCFKMLQQPKTFVLPKDKVTVAVHVRKGGGYDHPATSLLLPLKMPPDSYYIEQIRRIFNIFQKPLYVYIFTDDLNPLAIASYYQQALQNPFITFDCRRVGNGPHANVLDDLYMMTQFDCLIHPTSNLSIVAAKLGNHKITISPCRYRWNQGQLLITQTQLKFNAGH